MPGKKRGKQSGTFRTRNGSLLLRRVNSELSILIQRGDEKANASSGNGDLSFAMRSVETARGLIFEAIKLMEKKP